MTDLPVRKLEEKCVRLRRLIAELSWRAQAGHLASSLSCVEILVAVHYAAGLRIGPFWRNRSERDRFVLSKGHGSLALYGILADLGWFATRDLDAFCRPGSIFGGEPTLSIPGVEAATGSLGHGLSLAVGMALYGKMRNLDNLTYVLTGDGECDEGSVWEAALSIAKYNLNNLVWIVDYNRIQATGATDDVLPLGDFAARLAAFGFSVKQVDGHDLTALSQVLTVDRIHLPDRPVAILAKTHTGRGLPFLEDRPDSHYYRMDEAAYRRAMEILSGKEAEMR